YSIASVFGMRNRTNAFATSSCEGPGNPCNLSAGTRTNRTCPVSSTMKASAFQRCLLRPRALKADDMGIGLVCLRMVWRCFFFCSPVRHSTVEFRHFPESLTEFIRQQGGLDSPAPVSFFACGHIHARARP